MPQKLVSGGGWSPEVPVCRETDVGGVATALLLATTVIVDGKTVPCGSVTRPAAVSEKPDGGPLGPHAQVHPALGQPLTVVSC